MGVRVRLWSYEGIVEWEVLSNLTGLNRFKHLFHRT